MFHRNENVVFKALGRNLYGRVCRSVAVTGPSGVGKTKAVEHFTAAVRCGDVQFLADRELRSLNCGTLVVGNCALDLGSTDLREDLLVLDSFGTLLQTKCPGLLASLKARMRQGQQFVFVLTPWEYDEYFANDAELLDLCGRVHIDEPDEVTALAIVQGVAENLAGDYGFPIDRKAVERAVSVSASRIWNEALPGKAIKVLRRAFDSVDYDRSELDIPRERVEVADVIRVLSEITRIPEETLRGDITDADYEQLLEEAVVGQREAVEAVADELRLIRAGITDLGKPASVMMFCGLNGVGKTELAKRLAELYSASKRLQVYTLGNFVESHSISGIIGVPAGYVGHDQGGRLVNDLLADPYGVFLLDEVEKAHPDVLKPFLNLFDEGWIVDQRGVRAYADRAIFILTSNAGADAVVQMTHNGRPHEEIVEHVKSTLSRVRNERSSQPVLSQAFLARLKRIIIFQPLDQEALLGIARRQVARMQQQWQQQRSKTIEIPEALIERLAAHCHAINERSNHREGGRSLRRVLSEKVEAVIQRAAAKRRQEYQAANRIVVAMEPEETPAESSFPQLRISFADGSASC